MNAKVCVGVYECGTTISSISHNGCTDHHDILFIVTLGPGEGHWGLSQLLQSIKLFIVVYSKNTGIYIFGCTFFLVRKE